MYFSLRGVVTHIDNNFLVLSVNNIGYQIFMPRPQELSLNKITTIYTYYVIKELEEYMTGFSSIEERSVFELLLKVNGIGPKTALLMLSKSTHKDLLLAIKSNNLAYLRRLPGVGNKAAQQILLDLRGEFDASRSKDIHQYDEVKQALKSLNFKIKEIDEALSTINIPNASNEEILKEALRKLRK